MNMIASVSRAAGPGNRAAPEWAGRLGRKLARGVASFVAALGLAGMGALLFIGLRDWRAREPAPPPAPKAEWIEHSRPIQMYALQTAEFGKDARLYESRSRREGGDRQDFLAYGAAEPGEGPGLRVAIYRAGADAAAGSTFFVDLARHAAKSGLSVVRAALPGALASRFGSFEVADVTIARGRVEAPCLGFRLAVADPGLLVTGFACGGAKPVDRPTLACALDRLDLIAAGEDHALAKFFLDAEQSRGKACPPSRGPGVKSTWLDPAGQVPALRTTTTARKSASR